MLLILLGYNIKQPTNKSKRKEGKKKMGFANSLNGSARRNTVRKDVDTKTITYISAAELAKIEAPMPLPLAGFFIKEGEYDKQITVSVDDGKNDPYGVNIPKRYVERFEALDDEAIDACIEGRVAIGAVEGDVKTPKGKTTMIEFIDVEG